MHKILSLMPSAYYRHGCTEDNEVWVCSSEFSVVRLYIVHKSELAVNGKVHTLLLCRIRADGIHGEIITNYIPYIVKREVGANEISHPIPPEIAELVTETVCAAFDIQDDRVGINVGLIYAVARACLYVEQELQVRVQKVLQAFFDYTKMKYRKETAKTV